MINRLNSLLLAALLAFAQIAPSFAQQTGTASLLPNGVQQFFTPSGKPVSNGTVTHYVPSTTTGKTVWQDAAETTPWPLHIPLNSGGFPASGTAIHGIYGSGDYRQIVTDQYNNVIWDVATSTNTAGSGGGGGPSIGDGQLPGAMQPWAGFTAPPNWAFAYGQALSRVTYPNLLANITYTATVVCAAGSPTLTNLADTSQITVGAEFEGTCTTPGLTIVSKTNSTVTLSGNANTSGTVPGTFFPWGNGDGATTFNVPDMRGVVPAGRPNMGGTNKNNLTIAGFGQATDGIGPVGGNETVMLSKQQMAPYTPSGNTVITDPGHTHTISPQGSGTIVSNGGGGLTGTGGPLGATTLSAQTAFTGISATFIGTPAGGGTAASALIATAGTGYTNGTQTVTLVGGTCTTAPQFNVTVASNVLTGTPSLLTPGSCTALPANPVSLTGGGGTGGKLTLSWNLTPQTATPVVQPTTIVNWIVKVLPDTSASIATGVSSIGGLTGVLNCGGHLICSANTIDAIPTQGAPPGGAVGQLQYNFNGSTFGGYTMGGDCTLVVASGAITCTKSNGVSFATGAFASTGTSGHAIPYLDGANAWSALQTFSSGLSTSALTVSGITGLTQCLQASSTGVISGVGAACGAGGGGAVNLVSNADGTLTIAPTTGNVVASLALGHANSWSALQTFGAGASASALTLSGVTGSTQCLHANTSGVVSGTAVDCGTGSVSSVSIIAGGGITQSGSPVTGSGSITVAVDAATNSNIYNSTTNKVLTANGAFGSAANMVALAGTSTVTPDFTTGINFTFTATSATNFTLANPTLISTMAGRTGCIFVTQPASGTPVTITYGTLWFASGGSASQALTATLGAQDQICYIVVSTSEIVFSIANALSH